MQFMNKTELRKYSCFHRGIYSIKKILKQIYHTHNPFKTM